MNRSQRLVTVLLAGLLCLGGCSGHYAFNDDEYRPLGDPASSKRGQ